MELQEFCNRVGQIVADNPVEDVPSLVAEILPSILGNPDLLTAAQKAVPAEGYGRHDVYLCPKDAFSIIAAVWPAGIVSPIHDHMTWCTFGIFEGAIEEKRYRCASDAADCLEAVTVETNVWQPGDVAHLPVGGGDIHRMRNPGDRAAVSVHVYGGNSAKLGPNLEKIYRETASALA